MANQKSKRYENPIDPKTGKGYFVPCVSKNKDSLVYFLLGIQHCAENILEELPEGATIRTKLALFSLRYTDILPDGKKINELTKKDYDEMEKEIKETEKDKHPDNNIKKEDHFLAITCPNCGNHYVFNHPMEIPDKTFLCGLCERVLIDYTNTDDWDFELYDGEIKL